ALCAPLATLARPPARASAAAERLAAEGRWQARALAGYRMASRMGDCVQYGEFRGGKVVRLSRSDCFDTTRTVEWLFALVERAESWGLAAPRCAPSGCACRETRRFYAVYDEELGYPRAIRLHKVRTVDWATLLRNPATYPSALDCRTPPQVELLTVLELEPLP
ncbi:MAG TPA: hypothetical protein VNL77_11640, partial [Roseiflexaceae bacterium]|nr:hypothetical protein [Roseiflexaceae bacterium]